MFGKIKIKLPDWLLSIVTVFFIPLLIVGGFCLAYKLFYNQKIYPQVKVGYLNLGGKKYDQAQEQLQDLTDKIMGQGIKFSGLNKQVVINPLLVAPTDPDLARELIYFDNQKTIQQAWQIGRNNNWWQNLQQQLSALLNGQKISPQLTIDNTELINILKSYFTDLEQPAQDAQLIFGIDGQPAIKPEKRGQVFDYQQAMQELRVNLQNLNNEPVNLNLIADLPQVFQTDAESLLKKIPDILQLAPITIEYKKYSWQINRQQLTDWLEFSKNSQTKQTIFSLKRPKVIAWLATLGETVNIEPMDAKFELTEDGQAVEFQANRSGEIINLNATYQQFNKDIFEQRQSTTKLVIIITPAKVANADVNDLGINELIGIGQSNFSGSPKNRRHNIAVGSEKINGLLIKPGEEFSLVTTLGTTNAIAGYLPELVIRGNETIAEYGGGLCQVGTTLFRLALDTGLPITERRPHSYRVSYYEPAGTDATIYTPRPDLKFVNDTPAHLLIQTKIEGDELIFEFYGTTDDRQVNMTEPRVFNIRSPGPTRLIETTDLPVGKKNCTEVAHNGADAEFSRTITYADGEVKEEVWQSHYIPWPAVCFVGVEQLSEQPTKETE